VSQAAIKWTKYALNNWLRQAGPAFDASLAPELLGFDSPEVKEAPRTSKSARRFFPTKAHSELGGAGFWRMSSRREGGLLFRSIDRDLIGGGHYGQRSFEPRKQTEHTGAPTKPANVKKVLANPEPSTHGP
jgi:hypothetical protein